MKHLFLLLFFLLGVTFFSPVFAGNNGEEDSEEIPLEIINPGSVGAGNSKVPYRPLIAFLEGHTLTIPSFEDDLTFQVLSAGVVVYSEYVSARTCQILLPTTLFGSYEIRLLMGTYYFRGYITLY